MFKKIVTKVFNKDNTKVADVSTDMVTLSALCAYRDNLILENNSDFSVIDSELEISLNAIEETLKRIDAKS